ncbi:MAG: glycosyltransferase [Sphingobacteriales bacterium]|nr:glycosyltransferase [Sphingobacteriales bacterium]
MKILWLVSWYPNKISPFNGDFIQRHARAVSLFHDITVIHIARDKEKKITNSVLKTKNVSDKLTEQVIYYHTTNLILPSFDRMYSFRKYQQLFKREILEYIAENGKPHLVHVHVTMNAGILAVWLKENYNIPFVVTEHWSGLLPEANDNFYTKPFWFKLIWKKIISNALSISTVSFYLKENVSKITPITNCVVIPNVVDTGIFFPEVKKSTEDQFSLIHITRMDYQKNPEAVWKGFFEAASFGYSFKVLVYTDDVVKAEMFTAKYKLTNYVTIKPEVPQAELAIAMQHANALILFSKYETFGCVVAEANACGVPVIVSDIPVMHELVQEGVNGVFAASDNARSLGKIIVECVQQKYNFNKKLIADTAYAKYNYTAVGEMFSQWYKTAKK